jgi:hypothetical protein
MDKLAQINVVPISAYQNLSEMAMHTGRADRGGGDLIDDTLSSVVCKPPYSCKTGRSLCPQIEAGDC